MALMQGVLLNDCVTMAFYSFRTVTVRSYQMKILVKLDLSYVLLHSKFQLSVTVKNRSFAERYPIVEPFFEFSSFSGDPKKILHKLQNLKNGSAIGYRSARLLFFRAP